MSVTGRAFPRASEPDRYGIQYVLSGFAGSVPMP